MTPSHTLETLLVNAIREGDCLVWQGSRQPDGYGRVGYKGKDWRVHRLVYVLIHGPLPSTTLVRHSCDNPPCIESAHLLAGTHADNMLDMYARGRSADVSCPGERNGRAVLTESDVRAIRASSEPHPLLMSRFGVSRTTIRQIRKGQRWKSLA